jgi:hypothetical protein
MSQGESAGSSGLAPLEVYYHEGAHPLFLAIEDTEWRQALQIATEEPRQACTWVISTGTVETTFHWNLWRRLPLHEACRRQAPAWFISHLLSMYPAAAKLRTQFGELALHIAVESGSPPEVVNLLIVAHWPALVATDQSGRTPLSILQDSEMLALEDHKVVFESLTRSMETYQQILNRHEMDLESLKVTHAAGLVAIGSQHDDDLQVEQEQQEKLVQEVKRLKALLQDVEQSDAQKGNIIEEATRSNEALHRQVTTYQTELAREQERYQAKSALAQELEETLRDSSHNADVLTERIQELSMDLQEVGNWQEQELRSKVDASEETMQIMVEHFCGLTESLGVQQERVRHMLASRGLQKRGAPVPAASSRKTTTLRVDEKKDVDQEDDIQDDDALVSAALAASGALGLEG